MFEGYRRDAKVFGELVPLISEALARHPELRFGQLIQNINCDIGRGLDIFYTHDVEFIRGLKLYLKKDMPEEPTEDPERLETFEEDEDD